MINTARLDVISLRLAAGLLRMSGRLNLTRGWALDRVHNSRRPRDCLQYVFALWDPVTLTFDLLT